MHTTTLTDDDCFAIRQAARRISQFYERYLSRAGVTPSQYSILALLRERPGLTMATLSAVLVIERTALLRALKPLIGAALVTGRMEPRCRRQTFALTEHGEARIADAHVHWLAAQQAFEQRFGSAQAARLRDELFRITHNLPER
ncbi:winged helix-turn-helix transcriptional regulator [Burkholderia ambifaria]|jgi:DNA-binding MarR family transcriptional regulator|uniref:Transcriptional regulator, MarR family n=2 Tax=Burkholderia ambifaria TaxID=152480 RepID=Q0B489_BURCM|nr:MULTISPECIES: MarR family winged helix-turn-helix transcriptional regulator [Burkholderia]ABI91034.1 transcriptional regulator, MarR family [Burkholderia ambifaria AMMD]ACB66100.1 transcriptional regulator, MarR family [Burkholderia ambifaria MC40-6]AJY24072.1 winged helix DNA-binding domain protein [Burkholderia ambifaria AMMD]ELK6205734.1 winged helix-turn-helix transcriptional regulator [Burkholderia ambifaria]MBR7933529.1 winged helix-turn-helix transcriptional regulator [Burkholderia a